MSNSRSPRWRIDRTVARITLAGLVNVLGLFFAAGWLVGAHLLRPAAEEMMVPVVPTAIAETPVRKNPPTEQPLLRRNEAARQEPAERSASRWVPTWSTPTWPAAVSTASYRDLIRDAALYHSISPSLVEAMAHVESGFNAAAVSRKGARGLLQVLPATARRFGFQPDRLFEAEHNLAAGTAYLAWLLDRYGDLDRALAAYNAGEGAVDDHGGIPPYPETQAYVRRVKAALLEFEPSTDEQHVPDEPRKDGWEPFGFAQGLALEGDVEPSLQDVPLEKTDEGVPVPAAVEDRQGYSGEFSINLFPIQHTLQSHGIACEAQTDAIVSETSLEEGRMPLQLLDFSRALQGIGPGELLEDESLDGGPKIGGN